MWTYLPNEDLKRELELQKNEATLLQKLNHPNVINLLHLIERQHEFGLVFPLMKYSLFDLIYEEEYKYDIKQCQHIMKMLFAGLEHLHECHIMHRDLKPANILVSNNGCVKIADFGVSVEFRSNEYRMDQSGTVLYTAPEVFLKIGYTQAIDVWVSIFFNINTSIYFNILKLFGHFTR